MPDKSDESIVCDPLKDFSNEEEPEGAAEADAHATVERILSETERWGQHA